MSNTRFQLQATIAGTSLARRALCMAGRSAGYAILCLLLAWSLVLGFRRHALALGRPLEGQVLLMAGVLAAGAAAAARVLVRRSTWPTGLTTLPQVFEPLLSFSLIAWGVALSLVPPGPGGLFLLWSCLVIEEVWAWSTRGSLARDGASWQPRLGTETASPVGIPHSAPPPTANENPDAADSPRILSSPTIFQEFVRSQQPSGGELLRGWVRIPFVPGQRNATVHLAFCPPFEGVPRLEILQRVGPEVRIKVVQVLPLGARLDIKLDQPSSCDSSVILEVLARNVGEPVVSRSDLMNPP